MTEASISARAIISWSLVLELESKALKSSTAVWVGCWRVISADGSVALWREHIQQDLGSSLQSLEFRHQSGLQGRMEIALIEQQWTENQL